MFANAEVGLKAIARRVLRKMPVINRVRNWLRRKMARYETVFGYNPSSPTWSDYLLRNNMPEKCAELKRGLDETSLIVVDVFLSRMALLPIGNGYLGVTKMDVSYLENLLCRKNVFSIANGANM